MGAEMEGKGGLAGREVAFTGRLASMSRADAVRRLLEAGGTLAVLPGPATALLVTGQAIGHVGTGGRIARNMERFRELKEAGAPIRIVEESEFLAMLGAAEELEELNRLYTATQVSRIAETPLAEVRAWVRHGLLRPARMTFRLAWFEYRDILFAKHLSRLSAAGVTTSSIRRGLSEIARWLPEADWILGRLDAAEAGLRLRTRDGGWAEPSGQGLFDFESESRSVASLRSFPSEDAELGFWFARAQQAEEEGDLTAAAAGYRRSLEEKAEPLAAFNLGNVLYELGREGEAAEYYLAAIALDQEFVEAWNNLGNALAALGKPEDALRAYGRALALEPDYADAHCNLATVLEAQRRPQEAALHRAACAKAFPSERGLRLVRQTIAEDADQ